MGSDPLHDFMRGATFDGLFILIDQVGLLAWTWACFDACCALALLWAFIEVLKDRPESEFVGRHLDGPVHV
jgi:hypothetical protein